MNWIVDNPLPENAGWFMSEGVELSRQDAPIGGTDVVVEFFLGSSRRTATFNILELSPTRETVSRPQEKAKPGKSPSRSKQPQKRTRKKASP